MSFWFAFGIAVPSPLRGTSGKTSIRVSILMSPGDFNGDNLIDMIAITPGGEVRLYKSDGRGTWLNGGVGITIASGWNTFNAVF